MPCMLFSKSFGYALRSVLYVSSAGEEKVRISLNEIAERLNIPRHFLGKVMKKVVKEGVLSSQKGPTGGFSANESTLDTPLLSFVKITGEPIQFDSCVLRLQKCNNKNPCPLHQQAQILREQWLHLLSSTRIRDLLKKDQPDFISSITTL